MILHENKVALLFSFFFFFRNVHTVFIVNIQVYISIIKCPLFFTSSQTHSLTVFFIYLSLVIIDAEKLFYLPNSHLNIIFEKNTYLSYFSLFKI